MERVETSCAPAPGEPEVPFPHPLPMFCPVCQQDVPALAVPEEPGVVRCALCNEELEVRSHESATTPPLGVNRYETAGDLELDEYPVFREVEEPAKNSEQEKPSPLPVPPPSPRPDLSDWDLEPKVRAAERLLKGLRQTAPAESAPAETVTAIHAAHAQAPGWHVPASRHSTSTESAERRHQPAPAPSEKSG